MELQLLHKKLNFLGAITHSKDIERAVFLSFSLKQSVCQPFCLIREHVNERNFGPKLPSIRPTLTLSPSTDGYWKFRRQVVVWEQNKH